MAEEVFIIDGITRREIIEDMSDVLGVTINPHDGRITREMCQELAHELALVDPAEREPLYNMLLGRIAHASGLHREAQSS